MTANIKKGFTLIELLIVMAILGVLAVVVLVAINPVQQLARTRDAGRKSGITQIGHAVEAYYTARNGVHPDAASWLTTLSTSGELSTIPSAITYSVGSATACTSNAVSNWCYLTNAGYAAVYSTMESNVETSKCGTSAWFMYATKAGRGGIVCSVPSDASNPPAWSATQ